MKHIIRITTLAAAGLLLAACGDNGDRQARDDAGQAAVTPADADKFVAGINQDLRRMSPELSKSAWIASTYITPDSQFLAAKSNENFLNWMARTVEASKRFTDLELSPQTARAIKLIQTGTSMPAPSDPQKVAELAQLAASMEAMYGAGKYCPEDEGGKCYSLTELENIIDDPEASPQDKLEAWVGWRTISMPMRKDYQRFVELTNEGAKELGFSDTGALWRSAYDMSPEEFTQVSNQLWEDVKPLYDALHCYVRDRLADHYGEDVVPRQGPIPAHLLGNMWSQEWANIYPLVEPFEGVSDLDVSRTLKARRDQKLGELIAARGGQLSAEEMVEVNREADEWIALEMVKSAENFYTSMGLRELPTSFWQNSMFLKPRDRDVVCHASAWDMDMQGDVRIKMCIEPVHEDLTTVYHELGHLYYDLAYNKQEPIFQGAAHDGFHEAIGDTIELSMTPDYLASQGLVQDVATDERATINNQMKMALNKVAFLPFGKLIDEWRWKVFAGEITPENYNAGWWELRTAYQGIKPPVERTEEHFDPGAKYHIPGNTPYTRYFLARILQFQFYKSLCEAAGHEGPLHECSFYGSEEAGKRFWAMLEKGASQPWQDTLYELTGSREMSGEPMIEYFQPLMSYLEEQNQGRQCGW